MDMLPTLAPLAGVRDIKANGPRDGLDVRDLLRGELDARSKPIPFEWRGTYGLIDNRYKIIVGNPSPLGKKKNKKGGGAPAAGAEEVYLYDIVADRGEQKNQAKSEPKVLADLLAKAKRWYADATAGR